jgi:hypothetical protein
MVQLTRKKADYLRKLIKNDSVIAEIPIVLRDNSVTTCGSFSERIGNRLTELLAKGGFDSEYKLTADGELLEDLIDAFVKP